MPVQTLIVFCLPIIYSCRLVFFLFRSLQPHRAEAETGGHLGHHGENAEGDPRQDHRQLQQKAAAALQVRDLLLNPVQMSSVKTLPTEGV